LFKSRKPLVAFILALVVFFGFIGAAKFYISINVELVQAVAAAEKIPPRTEISPEMLKVIQVPKGYLPEGSAPSVEIFARNKYYTGEIGLHPGEIVTKNKVFTEEEIAYSYALTLPPDMTILGVSTDLVRSAGASIYPGAKVRALAYIPAKELRREVIRPSSVEVIFDNIQVVGVVNTEGAETTAEDQRRKVPSVVKLAVTHDQEKVLIRYQEEKGYKVWFTVLPENYQPDPNIKDYYYRLEHGLEEELHTPSEEVAAEVIDRRG